MRNRHYSFKDVNMLMASRIIVSNFLLHMSELEHLRTNWNEAYANALLQKIDYAIDTFIGMDKKKQLKETTVLVNAIQHKATRNLSSLKTQILIDFPEEAPKMLRKLGYPKNDSNYFKWDQEALIQFLYTFKKGMTDKLKEKICSKGIRPDLIEQIVLAADELKHFNTRQESLKKTTKQLTGGASSDLNAIYHEVAGIGKMARSFYRGQREIQEQFEFKGIVENMNHG